MPSYDAIVIGGGVNGMAAAGRLAKSGRKVLLFESRKELGGGAARRSFAEGYSVDGAAHLLHLLDSRVEDQLDLASHGLRYLETALPTTALSADGRHLRFEGVYGETLSGDISPKEKQAWAALRERLLLHAETLKPFKQMTPPRLEQKAGNDMLALAKIGLGLRRRGRANLQDFLRLLLINIYDVLDEELTDERLKGLIAHDAVLGAYTGPRSPNSLLLLLNRLAGEVKGSAGALALPAGGVAAVAASLVKAIAALKVECRTNAGVAAIRIENDRAVGVRLSSGEEMSAGMIVSAINPRITFLDLVGHRHLDIGFMRGIEAIRMRASTAKLHLALNGAPDFLKADLKSRLVIAPSSNAVEEAFNAVKYNQFSATPVMEIMMPSAFEQGFAPQGHHVLSAIVQFAPTELAGGWAKGKPAFLKAIMQRLETYAPGIGKQVVKAELLTPQDIESEYGFIGGNWHHGEFAVERMLFLRPMPGLAQYETPIGNLYLAGAGSHPGGGISGAAGWNAAERILQKGARR